MQKEYWNLLTPEDRSFLLFKEIENLKTALIERVTPLLILAFAFGVVLGLYLNS